MAGGGSLPAGTVTLVFSDIEGSTGMLHRLRGQYATLLADHHRLVDAAVREAGGQVISTEGDGVYAVFARAGDAVRAAAEVQRAMARHAWPAGEQVRVRMGLHTGEPIVSGPRYVGLDVHRAARICSTAHGGQVLLSRLTSGLVQDDLPEGVTLRDLGPARLKDFDRDEHLTQLVIDNLPADFPPPRAHQPPSPDRPALGGDESLAVHPLAGAGVRVRLLGPVDATRDGADVRIGAMKQRMLLAALALRIGETVSADVLIDVLWGERPPPTAAKALQVNVSQLRRLLEPKRDAGGVIQTTPGGYRLVLGSDALDLAQFERQWESGRVALESDAVDDAVAALGDALSMWRGDALSDLRYEQAFEADAARLEEMRLAAREDLMEARLAAGAHDRLIAELERLVADHPLRERVRGQLMLALYRSGRQADALAAFRAAREALIEQLGIDPSPALVELERRILNQDEKLEAPRRRGGAAGTELAKTLLVVSQSSSDIDGLLRVAVSLTGDTDEIVLARMLTDLPGRDNSGRLRELTQRLAERRDTLQAQGVRARVAAFSSVHPAVDLAKLATHQDAALLLVEGSRELLDGRVALAAELLDQTPCDLALSISRDETSSNGRGIFVPFGGSQDDWAALELGGRIAERLGAPLVLAGSERMGKEGDASRLLATASLILQRLVKVAAEPLLIPPGADGVLDAAAGAELIVVGLSPRYRTEGLGETRQAIAKRADTPSLFVRRGSRPGILAPPSSLTRFRWSTVAAGG